MLQKLSIEPAVKILLKNFFVRSKRVLTLLLIVCFLFEGTPIHLAGANSREDTKPVQVEGNHLQSETVLVQPADGAIGVSTSATLEVETGSPGGDPANVTFYGRDADASSIEDFSLIALPDIQNYASYYPGVFTSQIQWIINNASAANIAFVSQLGDLVNTAESTTEYQRIDESFDLLDETDIPYSVVPGNHDYPTTNYNIYFGVDRFAGRSWYGGNYDGTNENNYALFSADGMDFILINLEYDPYPEVLDWADTLLKTYNERRAIVASHNILNLDDSWGYQDIYDALQDNPNLFLMLCAHNHTETDGVAFRADMADDGHTIYTVLSDYQDFPEGGYGYLRIFRFSPADDKIYISTYSPYHDVFLTTTGNTLTLDYDMVSTTSFELLGNYEDVPAGSRISHLWTGLAENTQYEWYVEEDDGASTTTSSMWSFTTGHATNQPPQITEGPTVDVEMAEDSDPTAFGLTLHATDPDAGDTLTWNISSAPSHGAASAEGTGASKQIGYTPAADYNGTDHFDVQVSDGNGGTDTITVNVTIDAENDAPLCSAVTLLTEKDTPGDISPSCTDVDDDSITYSIATQGTHGTASVATDLLHFVPVSGYVGDDSFTYKAYDGHSDSNAALATITIAAANYAPIINEGASKVEDISEDDSPVTFNLTLHATDKNPDDILTWSISRTPTHGVANGSGTGVSQNIEYIPATNYHGSDSFEVEVSDGNGGVATILINVNIEPVNDPPVLAAIGDKTIAEQFTLAFTASAADADLPLDTLTYSLIGAPAGARIDPATGEFSWTPTREQGPGAYKFKVKVVDAGSPPLSDEEDITITVEDPYSLYIPMLITP